MIYKGRAFEIIEANDVFNGNIGVLANKRGYDNIQEATIDNSKTYTTHKHNPFLMEDMDKAVEVIKRHLDNNSRIVIFGDYDVDGISATAVMAKGLSYMGYDNNLEVIIPNRVIGYSIKKEYIIKELENNMQKPDLIITVDCGIKNVADVDYIVNELGIEVVITDHHGVDDANLPLSASAIVNPHRAGSQYPFQDISGSLVALKVMEALNYDNYVPFITGPNGNPNLALTELEELAMLGTVADVMPIQNENKWLVKETLPRLSQSKNLGLLVFTNNLRKEQQQSSEDADYNTDFIGWSIGPRINAAGRIDNPYLPLELLLTNDRETADRVYTMLNSINENRQDMVKEDYHKAKEEVDTTQRGIVYVNKEIADGVIGLIAGRLKEDFYLPTITIGAESNGIYKGSGRSIPGLNIYEALIAINEYFIENISKDVNEPLMVGFGGHPLAAGLSIKEEYIGYFIDLFQEYCNEYVTDSMMEKVLRIDGTVTDFSSVSLDTLHSLKTFGPYGQGNPEPLFLFQGELVNIEKIGKKQNTIKIVMKDLNGKTLDFILFRYNYIEALGSVIDQIIESNYRGRLGIVGKLTRNNFRGIDSLQIQVEDVVI